MTFLFPVLIGLKMHQIASTESHFKKIFQMLATIIWGLASQKRLENTDYCDLTACVISAKLTVLTKYGRLCFFWKMSSFDRFRLIN